VDFEGEVEHRERVLIVAYVVLEEFLFTGRKAIAEFSKSTF
jgi:hypothetical protein